jgi:hypothetical protein
MASDFYRLRIVQLDDGDTPDLDWRDDILYRKPPAESLGEYARWLVQAVDIADEESVTAIAHFDDRPAAQEHLEAASEALVDLTRVEFEERFFPAT